MGKMSSSEKKANVREHERLKNQDLFLYVLTINQALD